MTTSCACVYLVCISASHLRPLLNLNQQRARGSMRAQSAIFQHHCRGGSCVVVVVVVATECVAWRLQLDVRACSKAGIYYSGRAGGMRVRRT